jgi:hypothetical protein
MPYTIEDFPIETSEPKVDVTLEEGRYVFELVVEDDAGLRSTPDRVVITVTREYVDEPIITGIAPVWGRQGQTIEAVIHGRNLFHADEVKFWRGSHEDPRVMATIIDEGHTDTELPVSIHIRGNAALGGRSFTVTTPGGTAESPSDVIFNVVSVPVVTDINPEYATEGDEVIVHVHGRHLLVPSEPLSEHEVEFFYGSEVDAGVAVKFAEDEESTAEMLALDVRVGSNAKFGMHRVRVTTPAGEVDSDELFDVRRSS